MEKCCDVEGIRSLTKVIKHFWLKIWEGTIIWLIESDRSIYTFHSVKCNNVEFLISDQDVWHGWIPSIPRKRIRGIYPPSGLKESSLGSSSSWSNKTWIEKEKFINVNDVPHTVKQYTNHGTLIAIFFLIIMTKGWAAFPHLQVDHDKAVCKLRDFLGLGKFGLECFSNNKSQLILIHLLSKPPPPTTSHLQSLLNASIYLMCMFLDWEETRAARETPQRHNHCDSPPPPQWSWLALYLSVVNFCSSWNMKICRSATLQYTLIIFQFLRTA